MSLEDSDRPHGMPRARATMRRFLALFLPSALLIALALLAYRDHVFADRLTEARFRERAAVAAVAQQLSRDLARVADDVSILAGSPGMRDYLRTGGAAYRERVAAGFLNLADNVETYAQIRFIDAEGRERIRVNRTDGEPVRVAEADLQNKSGRYYFEDTLRLAAGHVFVSPLDLNVEHGAVEVPHRPMIRLGTPVFDARHRRRGIVLVNYLGSALLDRARSAMAGEGALMVLNAEGYWLSAPDPADAWGFMLPHGRRFADRHGQAWAAVSENEAGAVATDDGLFVFDSVTPLAAGMRSSDGSPQPLAPSTTLLSGEDYRWTVVSRLDPQALAAGSPSLGETGLAFLGLAAAAGGVEWGFLWIAGRRRRAEAEERAAAARFRLLAEHSGDMIALHAADGRFLYVSPSVTRLLGFAPGELVGRRLDDLAVADGAGPGPGPWARLTAGAPEETPDSYRVWRRDGTWIWFETVGSQVPGGPAGGRYVTVSRDVSERQRYEAELQEQRSRVEDQAVRLTEVAEGLALARRAAETAQADAESANRAKSEFLASMSHELRTPLNSILGFSEIIRDQVFGPVGVARYLEYAGDIHDSGQHLLELINDVLDLSKIEAGKIELRPSMLEAETVLEHCVRMVRDRAARKSVSVDLVLGERRPTLYADERAVRQIMFNLLSNAVKFTPVGGSVRVLLDRLADGGTRIAVADTGCGIPAGQIARLMLPFEQIDNGFGRAREGTGLGLAIAKSMAALHGGVLDIESEEGRGTVASIVFPPPPAALFGPPANADRSPEMAAV